MKILTSITLMFIIIIYCCNCYVSDASEARIAFTGDIIMHIPVKNSAFAHNTIDKNSNKSLNNRGFDFLFDKIKNYFTTQDIVVGNLEFPVSPPFESKPKVFNCVPEILPALKRAGFTMMNTANNHVLDQGEKGLVNTIKFLGENDLDYIGIGPDEQASRAGIVKEVNGIRIGFMAYTGYLNFRVPEKQIRYHLNWFYDKEDVKQDIQAIKRRCDYLIMVVHTGIEYTAFPRPGDAEIMKSFLNEGVDLIIGHHPHVLQPAEKVVTSDGRTCLIFYSLANFISNQNTRAQIMIDGVPVTTRDAIIVRCILKKNAMGKRPSAHFEVVPVYTLNIIEDGTKLRSIQTLSLGQEIQRLKKRLSTADVKEKVDIERQIQNLNQKTKAIQKSILRNNTIDEITFIE